MGACEHQEEAAQTATPHVYSVVEFYNSTSARRMAVQREQSFWLNPNGILATRFVIG